METHTFPHLAHTHNTIHLSLFHDVRNASSVRSQLIASSTSDTPLNFAFIDAKVIASRDQLLNACLLAILAAERGEMRTRSIHSEVLWTLMPGSNISDSLKKIGISNTTTDLILLRIDSHQSSMSKDAILKQMTDLVQGDLDLLGLPDITSQQQQQLQHVDWKELQKLFKLPDVEWPLSANQSLDDSDAIHDAQSLVASLTAIKNVS